jgi:hypothetical protein
VAVAFDAEAGEEVELRNGGFGELVGCGECKGVDGHGNEQYLDNELRFDSIVLIVLSVA